MTDPAADLRSPATAPVSATERLRRWGPCISLGPASPEGEGSSQASSSQPSECQARAPAAHILWRPLIGGRPRQLLLLRPIDISIQAQEARAAASATGARSRSPRGRAADPAAPGGEAGHQHIGTDTFWTGPPPETSAPLPQVEMFIGPGAIDAAEAARDAAEAARDAAEAAIDAAEAARDIPEGP